MPRRTVRCIVFGSIAVLLGLQGCGGIGTDDLSVYGGRAEIGAKVFLGGRRIGVLKRSIWEGTAVVATATNREAWGDAAPGDTIVAPGDTVSELDPYFLRLPKGRVEIVVVGAAGDTIRGQGIFGDYNGIEVSFARHRMSVQAHWDVPRADPNGSS